MTLLEPWEHLVEAENTYFELRMGLGDDEFDQQMSKALAAPSGRSMALRVLKDVPLEHVERQIDRIFDYAARTHGPVGLAREVLSRLSFDFLERRLGPLVDQKTCHWIEEGITHNDEMWEDFQRTAEVLDQLKQKNLLEVLVARAKTSADPDVLEVAEWYQTGTSNPKN